MDKDKTTKLLDVLVKNNVEIARFMGSIDSTLRTINDNNLLHKTAIDTNTKATESLNRLVNSFLTFVKIIVLLLIGALIVLAGAEKVFQYIKIF